MITANQRRLKVGVLTPHAAAGPEIEVPDMSQGRVTVTVARIRAPENAAGTESTSAPTALRALTQPEAVDGDAACFGDGDLVAQHLTLHGTHQASTMPLLTPVSPSGRAAAWTFIHIWRVADGVIVEHWACRDDMGLLEQLSD